jgi:Na+-transporting NADH:ubiquinone oxidoreductase subunit A
LKPALKVDVGQRVRPGEALLEDKQRPGVLYTAPAGGSVNAIHRGARRALVSIVIDVDDSIAPLSLATVDAARTRLDAPAARALLLESGLWTALRTRPFARVALADHAPAAIFVTATDTRPHAIAPSIVIDARAEDFARGLEVLRALAPRLFVCVAEGHRVDTREGERVEFAGPHPSGNAGWHVHRLLPVGLHRSVWTIGYQDVLAIGRTLDTGMLDSERIIALGGPGARQPRLLRTRLGA